MKQGHFFFPNPFSKKSPRHVRVRNDTERVTENQLCSDGPVEPSHIARMAADAVDSGCYQLVLFLSSGSDQVVKIIECREHGDFPCKFAPNTQNKSNPTYNINRFPACGEKN